MKRIAVTGFILLAAATLGPVRADTPPDQTAREVSETIIKLIRANRDSYAKDYRKLYAMVDENVLPRFDFRKMSQMVVGPTWRTATEDQRARFTKEFRDLLVRVYATALLKYTNEEIIYLPLKVTSDDRTVVVKSQVRRADSSQPISINYHFYRHDGAWKVYDMAIEGPSIVTTYQRVYAERLQKENLDALIASLAQDNQRTSGPGPTSGARQ